MGARAYRYLSLYPPDPGCLVEVGSERGEGSTAFLYRYAKRHGLRFYTADIDPAAFKRAKSITPGARLTTGLKLLRRLRGPISVAYLDGFDWIPEGADNLDWIALQRRRYQRLGVEMNNHNCQREHLAEAEQIARKAARRCRVICDDTHNRGGWSGKGGLAVPFLESEGFTVTDHREPEGVSLGYVVLDR